MHSLTRCGGHASSGNVPGRHVSRPVGAAVSRRCVLVLSRLERVAVLGRSRRCTHREFEEFNNGLLRRRREVHVRRADSEERPRLSETDHLVDLDREFRDRLARADRDSKDDHGRTLFTDHLRGRACGGTCRDSIVDHNHVRARKREARANCPKHLDPLLERPSLLLYDAFDLGIADLGLLKHVGVEHECPAFTDRSHRELG